MTNPLPRPSSRLLRIATASGLAVLAAAGTAAAQPSTGSEPSSGQVVTGLATAGHGGSGVSPQHPAPSRHVTQPSSKLKNFRNQAREQIAPEPERPVKSGVNPAANDQPKR